MAFAAAHRGLSAEHAENTLAAFQAAMDAGFHCLEMDLRLTHDGHVVIMHDAGIDRTTDGNGRVKDFNWKELATYRTAEGPIPRLGDVMEALQKTGVHWNLEVKAEAAVEPTIQLVEDHGLEDHALVSSMSPTSLQRAQARHPDVPRGLIILGPPDNEDLAEAREAGCSWVNLDHDFVDAELVEQIRSEGFKIGVWTVNEVERAKELQAMGVDCVITDRRDVLVALGQDAPIKW